MAANMIAPNSTVVSPVFPGAKDGVVELPLLLSVKRAEALVALSARRHQSVAQVLRELIDRALVEDGARFSTP